ncbi:hypothetical protein ACGFIF_02045 [Kribbella sp. NPDC049174]|uniref:hypothetical protein n=1 Tax=Kribbella sp. NPDC049174 TaxID=3364112 RepID=UPI00371A3284
MNAGKGTDERQVAHGYYREHLFMEAREKADIRARFSTHAEREGYKLGKIFEEKVESVPAAFRDLVDAVLADHARAVVVPSLTHFAVLGHPIRVRDDIESALHVAVLVSDPRP